MKIVLISSGALVVPPPGYGGLEMIVYDLAECLDQLGHEVHVVAPTGSKFPGNIQHIDCGPPTPQAILWERNAYEKYAPMLLSEEFNGAVIHDHTWGKGVYLLKAANPRLNLMSTLHGMLCYGSPPPVEKPCMAGISIHHANTMAEGLKIQVRHVYNGINLDRYPISDGVRDDRFLFLARMTPFKGAHVFVELMNFIGQEGDLVGDDTMVEDQNYVAQLKAFCENSKTKYWGGVPRETAASMFRGAKAYILPCAPEWQEPFGLTVIEAMASGCPVIATASGAIPELVLDGKTGYIANTVQDLPELCKDDRIAAVKPEDCRKRAEEFSREKMAEAYVNLYHEVLAGGW